MAFYSQNYGYGRATLPPAVRFFLIASGAMFLLQVAPGSPVTLWLALHSDCLTSGAYWQLVTYIFLHGGLWHLILNMLGLFFFGPETERALGTRRFTLLYLVTGIIGGLGWLLFTGSGPGVCVGASGSIFGVLGAFAAMNPHRTITMLVFFVLPVTMRARTMAIGLGVFSLLAAMQGGGNIAHIAHLFGGLAGYFYIELIFHASSPIAWLNPLEWARLVKRKVNDVRWNRLRSQFKKVQPEQGWTNDGPPDQATVDAVLEKVSKFGLGSLTEKERDILKRASRR